MRLSTPSYRRLLALTCSLCAAGIPLRDGNAVTASQAPALTAVASGRARGGDPAAIRSGSLRLTHAEEGPQLAVEDLDLGPESRPPIQARGAPVAFAGDCLVISELDYSTRNRLGGRIRAFERAPSLATASLLEDATGRRVLRLMVDRGGSGFAGLSLGLHDSAAVNDTRYFLDASEIGSVALWVRVHAGEPSLRVAIADRSAADRGAADEPGSLAEFVPAGRLTGAWQQAVIPLARLGQATDRTQLAKLVLVAAPDTSGSVDLDRPALCRPDTRSLPPLTPRWAAAPSQPANPSLWIWHTRELAASAAEIRKLADFVAGQGIGTAYVQLPGELLRAQPDLAAAAAKLGPLNRSLRAAGARVFALDGAPQYAREASHTEVVGVVEQLQQYNERVDPEGRFAGIHYDIEPYLLEEFGDARRNEIVAEYLRLLERLHAAAAAAGLELEVAIPFWFDGVRVAGPEGRRPLSELVIDRADRVAIMDYRTDAAGSNGTVALAEQELVYASEVGTPLRIGLETTRLPDEELLHFRGTGHKGLPRGRSGHGFVVAGLDGGDLRFVWIEPGVDARQQLGDLTGRLRAARFWEITRRQELSASRLTFADLGAEALHRVMQQTAAELTRVPAFAGFAIHYYRPYAALLEAAATRPAGERP